MWALPLFGEFGLGCPAPPVAQGREPNRVPLSGDNGAHDRHAGAAGQIRDRAMDLNVHLIQRLLHPLDEARPFAHQIRQLSL